MSVIGRTLLGLFAVLVLLAMALAWAFFTESGLRAGLGLARNQIPDSVQFDALKGRLAGPLELVGLRLTTESAIVSLDRLQLDWSPGALLRRQLVVDSIRLSGVRVELLESSAEDSAEPVALPQHLPAPVDVLINELLVEDIQISQSGAVQDGEIEGAEVLVVDRLHARASWIDTSFAMADLSVVAPLGELHLAGETTTAGDYPLSVQIAAQLKQELAVPVLGELSLVAKGSLRDLSLEGTAKVIGETVPELLASYTATVQTDPADLMDYAVTSRLTITGENIDPARYVERLSGNVAVAAVVDLKQEKDGSPSIEVTKFSVDGELVDAALALEGAGSWRGDAGTVRGLQGLWGDYKLSVDGQVGANSTLDWSIDLPDLVPAGQLMEADWRGSIAGKGQLLGTLDAPRVVATLTAADLLLDGTQMRAVQLDADLALNGELQLDLLVADGSVAGEVVDELRLALSGVRDNHQIELTIDSPRAEIQLGATGALAASSDWAFDLSELELVHPDPDSNRPDHRWQLAEATRGEIAAAGFRLEPLCVTHVLPNDGGGLCIDAKAVADELSANVAVTDLGLANLNGLLPEDTRVAGLVSGTAQWSGDVGATEAGFALVDVGLALRQKDEWLDVASFAPGTLAITPTDDALLLGIELPLQGDKTKGVFVSLSAGVVNGSGTGTGELSGDLAGTVRAEVPELGWLATFVEQVDELTGSLSSDVMVAGTFAAPRLSGVTELELSRVSIADLDIELLNTQLRLEGTPDGLQLAGTSESGEGAIALNSTVSWSDQISITGTLKGSDFLVSDSADARVSVSPDLSGTFADQTLRLRGDVTVPLARITLDKVPEGAVTASKDQVFPEQEEAGAPLATDVQVRLLLGEEVSFEGLGLNANFGGSLAIRDRSGQATTATGEIEVIEGTYKAYGQNLSIKNGKLVFAGGPVTEPGLNVRAVRQATPEVEVGVLVQGSLRQPTLDVFSTPSLPQSDQLSYLVLGRPLSASSASENSILQQAAMALGVEGGQLVTDRIGKSLGVDTFGIESAPGTSNAQAALVVGKYLSPRLYVSYGYGLFEPLSTLRLEYQLGRLWRIVTESTNIATGGDFLWVHER